MTAAVDIFAVFHLRSGEYRAILNEVRVFCSGIIAAGLIKNSNASFIIYQHRGTLIWNFSVISKRPNQKITLLIASKQASLCHAGVEIDLSPFREEQRVWA